MDITSKSPIACALGNDVVVDLIYMLFIEQAISNRDLYVLDTIVNYCHDSLFESICILTSCFDMHSLQKTISQTLYNSYKVNDIMEINFLSRYLNVENTVRIEESISNWEAYIVSQCANVVQRRKNKGS